MPFGLVNTLAFFQAYINKAIMELINIFYIIYFDDIFIYISFIDFAIYEKAIKKVLIYFEEFKLYTNLKKCDFLVSKIEFLGFIIKRNGVIMDL